VDKGGVNHAIRHGCSSAQAFQIFKITPMRLGASGGKRLGGRIGASEAENLMARADELLNDGRPDEACSSGKEYTHKFLLECSLQDN
jgi:hypothetical protein